MPTKCFFKSIGDAVSYARHHGGWIAECHNGMVVWYDATEWTVTPISHDVLQYGGASIGTWPLFDAGHECHQFLTDSVDIMGVLQ